MSRFLGPIIATNDMDAWHRLLGDGFQMQASEPRALQAQEMQSIFGVSSTGASGVWFTSHASDAGIYVLQLADGGTEPIRDYTSGYDCNALKVIDFFAPEFDKAVSHLNELGYELKGDIARYNIGEAHITEGHLWGPDAVVCALISGPVWFFKDFATVTDQLFSEIVSVSAPVNNQPDVVAFYEAIGMREVYRYEIDDESFQHLVGAGNRLHIRAINMGRSSTQPYLGLIHYGLPKDSYRSLQALARLPRRGLIGAIVAVDDVARVVDHCERRGHRIVGKSGDCLFASGRASATIEAPHGVPHVLVDDF